ncbi:MAG: DMT family transporter, partial [Sneathiellales bacterium]|nr:DMT family transporter [Sneathiellales bacterium]
VVFMTGQKFPSDKTIWKRLLLQSFLTASGAWTVLAWGQQYVDSSLATVLNSTSPIFVFFFTLFVTRHESLNIYKLIGATLGLGGVILIVGVDALEGFGQVVWAQIAVIFGAMLYASAAIHGKRFSNLSPLITAASTMMLASVCLVPISLVIDKPWTLEPSLTSLLAVSVLGVLGTGFALLLYFRLINTLGSLGVASQAYLRVGIGVMLGVLILGETITPVMGIGLLAAICGVAMINLLGNRG